MWGSKVMLMGTGMVKGAFAFQFDLEQFFQHTDVDTPAGDLIMIPPPRYQQKRDDGTRLYWKAIKWLQGAKGTARASHLKLVMLLPGMHSPPSCHCPPLLPGLHACLAQ